MIFSTWILGRRFIIASGVSGYCDVVFEIFAPAIGTGIVFRAMAAAIRSEIVGAFHERPRMIDDLADAREQVLRRDRLGEEFGDAGIARRFDAVAFGVAGHHDDRDV